MCPDYDAVEPPTPVINSALQSAITLDGRSNDFCGDDYKDDLLMTPAGCIRHKQHARYAAPVINGEIVDPNYRNYYFLDNRAVDFPDFMTEGNYSIMMPSIHNEEWQGGRFFRLENLSPYTIKADAYFILWKPS